VSQDMGRAWGEVHDAVEALVASIEDKLATARASGEQPDLIHELQQSLNEVRSALAAISNDD